MIMDEKAIKEYLHQHVCSKCLDELYKRHPKALGCIFIENDDEHLCPEAEKLGE